MSKTIPVRVDVELFESAKSAGTTLSRSAAQQLAHWALLGRALESAPDTSVGDIQRVLAGTGSYDSLSASDQAIVRTAWDETAAERRRRLYLAAEFTAAGRSWSEADEQGRLVRRTGADS